MFSRLAAIILLSSIAIAQSGCNYEILKDNGRPARGAGGGEKPTADVIDFETVKAKVLHPRCFKCHDSGSTDGDFSTYATTMAFVTAGDVGASKLFTELKNNPGGAMPQKAPQIPDEEAALIRAWIEGGALEKSAPSQPVPPPRRGPEPEPGPQPAPEPGPQPAPEPMPEPGPQPQPVPEPGPAPAPGPGPQPQPVPPGPGPVPPTIPLEPTFASIMSNVIAPKCVTCHSGATPKGEVDLSSYDAIIKHPDDDADTDLVRPSDSANSVLYIVVRDEEMPRKKDIKAGKAIPVTPEEREAIKNWIDAGAHP